MQPTFIITSQQVEHVLTVKQSIDLLRDAFRALGQGRAQLPLRNLMWLPDKQNIFGVMPCSITLENGEMIFGCKALSVFFTNMGKGLESHQGVVLLFEGQYGQINAVIDASSITKIRTAGASALATQYLARSDAQGPLTLCILGSGVQAESHLEAMLAVRKINKVKVWSRTFSNATKFAQRAQAKFGVKVEAYESAEHTVRDSDIICTVTASRTPILHVEWLKPGVHINAVGSASAKTRELDTGTIVAAKVYTDKRESLLAEAGDYIIPLNEGAISENHLIGELAELVNGTIPGRQSDTDITVFKSLGIAIEDLICAKYVHDEIKRQSQTALQVNLHTT